MENTPHQPLDGATTLHHAQRLLALQRDIRAAQSLNENLKLARGMLEETDAQPPQLSVLREAMAVTRMMVARMEELVESKKSETASVMARKIEAGDAETLALMERFAAIRHKLEQLVSDPKYISDEEDAGKETTLPDAVLIRRYKRYLDELEANRSAGAVLDL